MVDVNIVSKDTTKTQNPDGTVIQTWKGRFKVEELGSGVRFIENGKARTIFGTITVIEE